jgi:hypothetical protein
MHYRSGLRALACSLVLLATACVSRPNTDATANELTRRLDTRLAPEIAAGRVTVQRLPDGALVVFSDGVVFPTNGVKGRFAIASVIQGLLAPSLLRIEVSGPSSAPGSVPDAQARAVTSFFEDYGISASPLSTLAPEPSPGAGGSGVTITIRVVPA